MRLRLTSPAFAEGALIPPQFTCDGGDFSPALEWSEPPSGTRSLALLVDDPDAPGGVWVHWVLFNLPPQTRFLPAHVAPEQRLGLGECQGTNSWGRIGYGGPCPPSGVHRYFFKLYALDVLLPLAPGATLAEVTTAMRGHIVAEGELMGRYGR